MIREIKYVATNNVDYFTCHALFSTITNNELRKKKINAYSRQPQYKVSFQDRLITVLLNTIDFVIEELPESLNFNNNGKEINLFLFTDKEYTPKNEFKNNDFVSIQGVISYAKKITKPQKAIHGESLRKHISPFNNYGEFISTEKEHALNYLEEKLGLLLKDKAQDRELRFEPFSYKVFEKENPVYSKSSNNKLSLHNVFSFSFQAYIKNEDIANMLEYSSIGKKRSYGFGNIFISKL